MAARFAEALRAAVARLRRAGEIPPAKLHPRSLAAVQGRYGTPVPYTALTTANCVRMEEYLRMRNASDRAELMRRREAAAELAQRRRQDEWARELELERAAAAAAAKGVGGA